MRESPDAAQLRRRVAKLEAILEVAKSLVAQRELDTLLERIVASARDVAEAERGTIFLLDREKGELWSKVADGTRELRFPADKGIAGAVVSDRRTLNIPDAYADPRFHREFDKLSGFVTRQLLAVPMISTKGDVIGVLEVLNRRAEGPFCAEDEELLLAFASQAAGAVENALLYDQINRLLEGMLRASAIAIDSRDPATSGHSERVARLACALARAVDRRTDGRWVRERFDAARMRQLRYAALLHDFGKVGVRETVLTKAEKLYPAQLAAVAARFEAIGYALKLESSRRRAAGIEDPGLEDRLAELDEIRSFVLSCNSPARLDRAALERLEAIARRTYPAEDGPKPYLTEAELASLRIPAGNLTDQDRADIESHVEHTRRFLSAIPWSSELRGVPEIAYSHHESLDGRGYPRGLRGPQIGLEPRILAIIDVFDALTASDRPYKRAIPVPRALDILRSMAKDGKLDEELLAIFIDEKVFETP